MKHFFQINDLKNKKSYFFNSQLKLIPPPNIQKVALGFPKAILFHPPLHNKIYAYVIDNKNRIQYFYTKEYKEQMENKKYNKFPKLIQPIQKLINECSKQNNDICKSILMMNECNFRIGHEKYKKLYNTNGTLTLSHKHLHKNGNNINIQFLGKKKEENFCSISPKSKLYSNLQSSIKNKKQLFNNINYNDVYNFLKEYNLKPKDIRQYSANSIFFSNLQKNIINDKPKKYLKNILQLTAQKMNHTPNVCKKEYLMPQWFNEDKLEEIQKYAQNNNFEKTINYIIKKN